LHALPLSLAVCVLAAVLPWLSDFRSILLCCVLFPTLHHIGCSPVLVEPLDGAKFPKSTLPFNFALGDGDTGGGSGGARGSGTLADSQGRKWVCTFASQNDAGRFAAALGVATVVAKAAANTPLANMSVRTAEALALFSFFLSFRLLFRFRWFLSDDP